MMYTSYYSSPKLKTTELTKISISRFIPKWYKDDLSHLVLLAPSKELLNGYKNGSIDNDEYTEIYLCQLDNLKCLKELLEQLDTCGCVLLCYEKPGDFCHRHILSEYAREKFNIIIEELL